MTTTRRGRPPYADGQPRRVSTNLTIDAELLAHVDRLAQAYGISRSQVVNELLERALQG